MLFQIISDIHIEKYSSEIKKHIKPSAENLIIAGDLGHLEYFDEYSKALKVICQGFKKVILIPGNHEYYVYHNIISMNSINQKLKNLELKYKNLKVLINDFIYMGKYIIFGSTFWSYCQKENYNNPPIYSDKVDSEGKLLKITHREYNILHLESVKIIENMIEYSEKNNKELIIVTHYAPTFKGTLDKKYLNNSKNELYCSNNEHLIRNKIIKVWIYGHTGYNGIFEKLITNQMEHKGLKDAVLTLYD